MPDVTSQRAEVFFLLFFYHTQFLRAKEKKMDISDEFADDKRQNVVRGNWQKEIPITQGL